MKTSSFLLFAFLSLSLFNSDTSILYDYHEGIAQAKETGKPIFLLFTGRTCRGPEIINELIKTNKKITKVLKEKYVPVFLYVDDQTKLEKPYEVLRDGKRIRLKTKGNAWGHLEMNKFKHNMQPMMLIIDSDEVVLKEPLKGVVNEEQLLNYLE